jgi:hypothetical protein
LNEIKNDRSFRDSVFGESGKCTGESGPEKSKGKS